jgi:hypothetical protein
VGGPQLPDPAEAARRILLELGELCRRALHAFTAAAADNLLGLRWLVCAAA